MGRVSVILPTFNEVRHGLLERILAPLADPLEVLVVDSGSTDGTVDVVRGFANARLLSIAPTSRGGRLDAGLKAATGDVLFLHHPRSLPDPAVFRWLGEADAAELTWGALTHAFDQSHPLLAFTSWYSNQVRGDGRGIYYLDHCLFVCRRLWSTDDDFPHAEVFEDTLFCRLLRARGRPLRLPFVSRTSAVRFVKNGVYRQAALNQISKLAFNLGVSPATINRWYERGLGFNQPP